MRGEGGMSWFHRFANAVLRVVIPRLLRVDLRGIEHAPKSGALIIAINHIAFIDPILAAVYVRDDVLPMAKAELFKFPIAPIFRGYGAFPVRRGEGDLGALKHALHLLKRGHALLISPEGTRTKSGTLEEAHEGTALIALRSHAPILPIAQWGAKNFWRNLARLRRTLINVRVGEPLAITPLNGKPSRETLRVITDEVMYYLARMLPPELRGKYMDVENFTPRYVFPARELVPSAAYGAEQEVMPLAK
jgi:1-acyl-sn-glycerol-3-phosphate acyltransferase